MAARKAAMEDNFQLELARKVVVVDPTTGKRTTKEIVHHGIFFMAGNANHIEKFVRTVSQYL